MQRSKGLITELGYVLGQFLHKLKNVNSVYPRLVNATLFVEAKD